MKEQEKSQSKNGFPPSNLPRDPETGYFLDVPARIREIYKHNCFMSDFFHISTGSDRRFCRRSCSNCKLFYGFHQ